MRWQDVDLDAATLSIDRAVSEVGGVIMEGKPKTKESQRTLQLDPATVAVLKRHRTAQKEERLTRGLRWQDTDIVFATESGEWLRRGQVSSAFIAAVKRSGLPKLGLHGLRHTWATAALSEHGQGYTTVSKHLGHSNVSTTLDIYSHALPDKAKEAACAVASGMVPVDY